MEGDASALYVRFLQHPYRIDRATAAIRRVADGQEAGFEETLSIFDLLCHSTAVPVAAPGFAAVNSLRGHAPVGVEARPSAYAERFGQQPEMFRQACEQWGGRRIHLGDAGYEFSVFRDLKIRLKLYLADDEFPASLTTLWTENALDYLFYETTFYVSGFLISQLVKTMETL